jgi:cell division protease FtsH
MSATYGMSPEIGPTSIGQRPGEVFIGRNLANMGNVSPGSEELVDSETRRLVHEAEETALRVLELNATVLEDLANSLLRPRRSPAPRSTSTWTP